MNPQARREGVRIEVEGDDFLLWDGERAHRVHPLTALVWRAADGTRTVAQLAAHVQEQLGMAVEQQTVWSALDVLADAGLLERRVSPPGGVSRFSRRDLLRHAGVTGLAATALGVSLPGLALAQSASRKQPDTSQEQRQKSEEEKLKTVKAPQTASEQKAKTDQEAQQKQSQERRDKQAQESHQKQSREADQKAAQRQAAQEQQTKEAAKKNTR